MAKDKAARVSNQLAEKQAAWNMEQAAKAEREAKLQRAKDDQGRERTVESADMVNKMFDGGVFNAQAVNTPFVGSTYYDQNGNQVQYKKASWETQKTKNAKGKTVTRRVQVPGTQGPLYLNKPGTQDFGAGWNDPKFFQQRSDAYVNQYMPEIDRQYSQAKANLGFSLSDAGTGDSSVAAMKRGQLDLDNTRAIGDVRLKGEAVANDLRSQVNNIRGSLLSNIQNTNDPNSVVMSAQSQLNNIQAAPVKYDALGDLFGGVASGIGGYMTGKTSAGYSGGGSGGNGSISKGSGAIKT